MSFLLAALLAASGASAAPATPAAADSGKVRCKRQVETGSLVKARKECHTEAEWEALRRQAREDRDRLQGPGYDSSNVTPAG